MSSRADKCRAQDLVIHHALSAMYAVGDVKESEEFVAEVRKQIARIEKLFGYEPYSWVP